MLSKSQIVHLVYQSERKVNLPDTGWAGLTFVYEPETIGSCLDNSHSIGITYKLEYRKAVIYKADDPNGAEQSRRAASRAIFEEMFGGILSRLKRVQYEIEYCDKETVAKSVNELIEAMES